MNFSRKDFLLGSVAAGLTAGCRSPFGALGTVDPNLTVLLSDVHVACGGIKTKWGEQPTYQNALFERTIDEILALRPRPARVVVFGDVALWFGWSRDYAASQPGFARLTAAGIEVFVTAGNHDHREPMFRYFPKQRDATPVPGRFVSVVDLGHADLLLLDTLRETGKAEGDGNAVGGDIDDAQLAWLSQEAKSRTRPFFCGCHHAPGDLNGKDVRKPLLASRFFSGWIHGHNHKVSESWFAEQWDSRRIRRVAVLPSTGWWGDIGYATLRTHPDRAVISYELKDFFFPTPLKAGETRPPEWDRIRAEHLGRKVTLDYFGVHE